MSPQSQVEMIINFMRIPSPAHAGLKNKLLTDEMEEYQSDEKSNHHGPGQHNLSGQFNRRQTF